MGPRRTTISFSSEDAPELHDHKVYVYYCRYSGRHALTTDCNLNTAPRRRTDHALVIDTSKYTAKMYTSDGGVKFLKRRAGAVEKQYRFNVGKLPIAYKTQPEGKYLYVLDNALTTSSVDDGGAGGGPTAKAAPVPPCISSTSQGGTQISLEIEDRGPRHAILKISADYVRVQIKNAIQNTAAVEELLDFLRGILGIRLAQLHLTRGETPRHKVVIIVGVTPDVVFEKIQSVIAKTKTRRHQHRF